MLETPGRAQVSMNLTNYEVTTPRTAFDAVEREATRRGVAVIESELVGLMPSRALAPGDEQHLRIRGFHAGMILENRLAEVAGTRHVTIE
jgi:glutamate formiminotransferase